MKNITHHKIYKVKDWNASKRHNGQYMLVYTLGNGSMVDEPRKRGYVVQKWHNQGGEGSRYFRNHKLAMDWMNVDALS
jgi:hypothetical protein